jgi:hypothetical protein
MASGITPESVMTVTIDGFGGDGSDEWYRLVSFPSKVKVTSMQLIINGEARGNVMEDNRQYYLGAVKGRQSDQTLEGVEPYFEDLFPFFGDNPKPTINCSTGKYVSNVAVPFEKPNDSYGWYSYGPYDGLVAQMDPDEYLCVFIGTDGGDFGSIDTSFSGAVVVIGYEGCGSNL